MSQNANHNYNLRPRKRIREYYEYEEDKESNLVENLSKRKCIQEEWDFLRNMNVEKYGECDVSLLTVSATHTKNYLLNDPVLDYYKFENDKSKVKRNNKSKSFTTTSSNSILCNKGNLYEDEIVKNLCNRYPNETATVLTNNERITNEHTKLTKKYILEGVPLIFQAVLYSENNQLRGVADILIRSDYINKLFDNEQINFEEEYYNAPLLNGKYHYRVIDIKWSTIPFNSNFETIRNTDRFPSYKGQLAIYNTIIGEIQGYTPPRAYILGKSYKHLKGKVLTLGKNSFERLGHIIYDDPKADYIFLEKTINAVEWRRDLAINGNSYKINPPSREELYPNMCNKYNDKYNSEKNKHADEIKEITCIWNLGINERKLAHNKGIYKWTDPKLNSKVVGINENSKKGKIIDNILKINRGEIKDNFYPKKVNNKQIEKSKLEFYIDLEAIDNMLMNDDINVKKSKSSSKVIFLIGLGYEENNEWKYEKFTFKKYSPNAHLLLINKMINFIMKKKKENNVKEQCKLYHWGNFERSVFNEINRKNNNQFKKLFNQCEFVDLNKIFKNEGIVIKGCMSFGLKDVVNAMYNNNMIKTKWDTNCTHGLQAMNEAIDAYNFFKEYYSKGWKQQKNMQNKFNKYTEILNDISQYNEVDCKVMWEIVSYIRTYRC
tara:strand:+ start:1796 stop:3781 length:1986 start_codon:yes stop_codon:yes gene_type:complete